MEREIRCSPSPRLGLFTAARCAPRAAPRAADGLTSDPRPPVPVIDASLAIDEDRPDFLCPAVAGGESDGRERASAVSNAGGLPFAFIVLEITPLASRVAHALPWPWPPRTGADIKNKQTLVRVTE